VHLLGVEDEVGLAHRVVGEEHVPHSAGDPNFLLEVILILIRDEERQFKSAAGFIAVKRVSLEAKSDLTVTSCCDLRTF